MTTESWIAYAAYLAWLACGLCDFIAHWRTDLPHTSGVAESATHLVQLALLGFATILLLAFGMGRGLGLALLALVLAHAVFGYIDTRIAFAAPRTVPPFEQHIHSVLDMAPVIAFGWLVASTWPAGIAGAWALQVRQPPLPVAAWCAVLLPACLLCVMPALWEFRAARRAQPSVAMFRRR